MTARTSHVPDTDGRRDFDFLHGRWHIANRKLADPRPDAPEEWREFEAEGECRPILGGLGNADTYRAPSFPGRGEFHGFALRLFEPATGLWRIWWASSVGNGRLDPGLSGRFTAGEGDFDGVDELAGRTIAVRFRWSAITADSARWEQFFSFDGGATFGRNWVMDFRRVED